MLTVLWEASRTAAAAMVLLGSICVLMGMTGIVFQTSAATDPRGPAAMRLARVMAVAGGALGLIGAMLAIPYFWQIGAIDANTCLLVEMGLLGVAVVWAVVSAALLDSAEAQA